MTKVRCVHRGRYVLVCDECGLVEGEEYGSRAEGLRRAHIHEREHGND